MPCSSASLLVASVCDLDGPGDSPVADGDGHGGGPGRGRSSFPGPGLIPPRGHAVTLTRRCADLPVPAPNWNMSPEPKEGLFPWPVWGPLPGWLGPGGNWQTGLATGLAGLLAGTLVLRACSVFSSASGAGRSTRSRWTQTWKPVPTGTVGQLDSRGSIGSAAEPWDWEMPTS